MPDTWIGEIARLSPAREWRRVGGETHPSESRDPRSQCDRQPRPQLVRKRLARHHVHSPGCPIDTDRPTSAAGRIRLPDAEAEARSRRSEVMDAVGRATGRSAAARAVASVLDIDEHAADELLGLPLSRFLPSA